VDVQDERVGDVVKAIEERAIEIAGAEDGVRGKLQARLDGWSAEQAVEGRKLAYRDRKDGVTVGLLRGPSVTEWSMWTCLTSLRDVEAGINLLLQADDLGEGSVPAFESAPADEEKTE